MAQEDVLRTYNDGVLRDDDFHRQAAQMACLVFLGIKNVAQY